MRRKEKIFFTFWFLVLIMFILVLPNCETEASEDTVTIAFASTELCKVFPHSLKGDKDKFVMIAMEYLAYHGISVAVICFGNTADLLREARKACMSLNRRFVFVDRNLVRCGGKLN